VIALGEPCSWVLPLVKCGSTALPRVHWSENAFHSMPQLSCAIAAGSAKVQHAQSKG
jgi:hypothetical protein